MLRKRMVSDATNVRKAKNERREPKRFILLEIYKVRGFFKLGCRKTFKLVTILFGDDILRVFSKAFPFQASKSLFLFFLMMVLPESFQRVILKSIGSAMSTD